MKKLIALVVLLTLAMAGVAEARPLPRRMPVHRRVTCSRRTFGRLPFGPRSRTLDGPASTATPLR